MKKNIQHYAQQPSEAETHIQLYQTDAEAKDNSQATANTSLAKTLRDKKRSLNNKAVVPAVVVPGLVNQFQDESQYRKASREIKEFLDVSQH